MNDIPTLFTELSKAPEKPDYRKLARDTLTPYGFTGALNEISLAYVAILLFECGHFVELVPGADVQAVCSILERARWVFVESFRQDSQTSALVKAVLRAGGDL